jgi:hypothetical protein
MVVYVSVRLGRLAEQLKTSEEAEKEGLSST